MDEFSNFPQGFPPESVITFPAGIPGLGLSRRFAILRPDGLEPIVVLQSADDERVGLPALPVHAVEPDYRLALTAEERGTIGAGPDDDALSLVCLAVVLVAEDRPPACNLAAPIVVNPRSRLGVQSLQLAAGYSPAHPLEAA